MLPAGLSSCIVAIAAALAAAPAFADPGAPPACTAASPRLTLADVLARVGNGPRNASLAARVRAAEALGEQAAARPNPSLTVSMEDLTGSGSFRALGQSETTLSVSQRLELGGQRARRTEAAEREAEVERAQSRLGSALVLAAAKKAWVELLAARHAHGIATESEALVGGLLAETRRRRELGAASEADFDRVSIAAAASVLQVSQAARRERIAAARLVALWGGAPSEVECVDGELAGPAGETAASPLAPASLPAVILAETEVAARRADVESARVQALPALQVGVGARYLAGPGDVSMVANLGVEVPLFHRNAGNIRAAEEELLSAQARATATRAEGESALVELEEAVDAARAQVVALDGTMLPAAARAWETLARAWREGSASMLEVLEARRQLAELRAGRVEALARFHETTADLEAACGQVLPSLSSVPAAVATTARSPR